MLTMFNQSKFSSNFLPSTGTIGQESGPSANNLGQNLSADGPSIGFQEASSSKGIPPLSQSFIPASSSIPVMF